MKHNGERVHSETYMTESVSLFSRISLQTHLF